MSENEKNVPKRRFKEFENAGNWEKREWKETIDISTNMVDPKSGNYDNLPHIGPGNIESFTGRLLDNINTVKEDNLISGKFHFNKGDVIYGKINPQLGKYVYAPYEGLASADAYVLNGKNGLDQAFLFTLLQTRNFFNYSVSVSMRSGMPKINRDELNVYNFMAPCKQEQEQIGEFFLNFDNLITLHQHKLDKMKALKKAYLTQMFPAEGERKPKLRFAGFSDDWEQYTFGDLAQYKKGPFGSALKKDIFVPKTSESIKVYEQQNAIKKNWKLERYFITQAYANKLNAFEVHAGDIIVSCAGTIGEIYVLPSDAEDGIINQALMRIRVNEDLIDKTLFKYLFSNMIDVFSKIHSNGSAMKNIPPFADLKPTSVYVPSKHEQHKVVSLLTNIDNLITLHQHKLDKLQKIKKAYLNEMFI